MNRKDARKIAETITNEQLQEMFNNAKDKIKDWTKVSNCNNGHSKGVAWNTLAKDFDTEKSYHMLAKTNMVREFGEFLPSEIKPTKKPKRNFPPPVHFDPKF